MNDNVQMFDSEVCSWKYPQDARKIARLSISGFQMWYLNQDSREMIFLGQFKEFRRFVFWNYTIKVKVLRMYYKIKRFLLPDA